MDKPTIICMSWLITAKLNFLYYHVQINSINSLKKVK